MIVAFIPARKGSRGVPDKNLIGIEGKNLVERAIESAYVPDIEYIDVLTDDERVAEIAIRYGVSLTTLPEKMTRDHTAMQIPISHALRPYIPIVDTFILLQPTSPFRTAKHVREALKLYDPMSEQSVVSVNERPIYPTKLLKYANGAVIGRSEATVPRQVSEPYYEPNGAIYIVSIDSFTELVPSSFLTQYCIPYWMSERDSIQIDTPFDLEIATCFAN